MAQNYNDTIHKMQTPFEMRAGLPKKEPKMLEDWEQNHVYEQMIKNNEGKRSTSCTTALRMPTAISTWVRP